MPNDLRLIVLGFNDTSTLEGHFVLSPREREKTERRNCSEGSDCRGDEREGNERQRRNRRNKNILPLPLPAVRTEGLAQL